MFLHFISRGCHLDAGRDSGTGCSSMWGCWGLEAPLLRWLDSPKTKLRWTTENKQEKDHIVTNQVKDGHSFQL